MRVLTLEGRALFILDFNGSICRFLYIKRLSFQSGINSIPREAKRGRARNRPRKIIDSTYKQINSNPEKDDSNPERKSSTPMKMQGPTLRSHASECGTKTKLPCDDCKSY